ncbi:thiamine-phosphate kinase [Ornithinibacillus sp. JPR2-1]|uniref:thiamine-phosphate kinase n=1 Tax=Ornithinibacillus sp. JPR2-1 TaxID=2094019 RepID=UPI0031E382F8
MDEFSFIQSIQQSYYRQPTLRKGVGDDAAIIRPSGEDIVVAKDMLVEHVHFIKSTMKPYHIGYKALAANLSDIAAMGATPAYYLVAISISNDWSNEELAEIYNGMKSLADRYKVDLIGGDTVSGTELVISITVIGYANRNISRLRSAAKEGDVVFVTGTLGDSQAGLHILQNAGTYKEEEYFKRRHQLPSPRVEFSLGLQQINRVALNDISDGIASEAHELAESSKVGMVLIEDKIPVHPAYAQFDSNLQYNWKLFGGEDFELLGTVSRSDWELVKQRAQQLSLRLTEIGYVTDEKDAGKLFLQQENGKIIQLEKKGYNHLSR